MAQMEHFHDPVMQQGSKGADLFVVSRGMDPVRKEYNRHILFQIHPNGGACIPEVSHAVS